MPRRNEALEAAVELIGDIPYRTEQTKDNHIKLLIHGAKKVVYISGAKPRMDKCWIKNVCQDVRHALRTRV